MIRAKAARGTSGEREKPVGKEGLLEDESQAARNVEAGGC